MVHYPSAENKIRAAFWIIGILLGGLLTYLTRYYLNTDGLIYLEIGDAVRHGNWRALVNHQWSPAYSVIIAFEQWLLGTTLANEVAQLKIVNFVTLVMAMASCDFFLRSLEDSFVPEAVSDGRPAPRGLVRAVLYSAFLVASLVWIRVRLASPDMLMLTYLLVLTSLILRIKNNHQAFVNFFLLGSILGLAFLTRTYMFVYSAVIIALAGLSVRDPRKALSRVVLAAIFMMALSAPLVVALSRDLGRFTFGEAGNYNYALFVASQGEPINPPRQLTSRPQALLFDEVPHSCFSPGADIAKRYEGKRPRFDLTAQIKALARNVLIIVRDSPWLLFAVFVWGMAQRRWAAPKLGSPVPPSNVVTLLGISITGVLMFALVLVEMRYIAPFLFIGLAGFVVLWRYKPLDGREVTLRNYSYYGICMVLLIITGGSVIDQVRRATSTSESKPAYETVFRENQQIAAFVKAKIALKPIRVGVVESSRMSVYWARLAGAKIVAEIPSVKEYVQAGPEDREKVRIKLREQSVACLVGRGSEFGFLFSEGWEKIPATSDYYIFVTENCR